MARYGHHEPVLLAEAMQWLNLGPGKVVVDATLGGGGHAAEALARILPGGFLIAIDRDPEAIEHARQRFAGQREHVHLFLGDFAELRRAVEEAGRDRVDAVLFDLGLSSHQLGLGRGFSFQIDEELSMKMGIEPGPTARDIVNTASQAELARIIGELGEERNARRIARAIVREREREPITTTGRLARIVESAVPGGRRYKLHPATRTFLGLRLATTGELQSLESALPAATAALVPGGRLVCISYQSHEDRRVKQFMRQAAASCVCPPEAPVCTCGKKAELRILTRRAIRPSESEIGRNPRARSAKLRAAEKR